MAGKRGIVSRAWGALRGSGRAAGTDLIGKRPLAQSFFTGRDPKFARKGSVLYSGAGGDAVEYAGTTLGKGGRKIHVLKENVGGKERYYSALDKHFKMPDTNAPGFNPTEWEKSLNLRELGGGDARRLQKMINRSTEAANTRSVGSLAYASGVTGGAFGGVARNWAPASVALGGTALAGYAGVGAFRTSSAQRFNTPQAWGVGQNSARRDGLEMQKYSHIDKFLEKKALGNYGLGGYLALDAAKDIVTGTKDSGGIMGGLSYTLARKVLPLSTRVRLPDTMAKNFADAAASEAGKSAFSAFERTMGQVFGKVKERSVDVPMRRQILQDIVRSDIMLQGVPMEQLRSWYNTLASYAPHISLDKNLVSSFLKQVANFDGQLDYGKLKELMDLEKSYEEILLKKRTK